MRLLLDVSAPFISLGLINYRPVFSRTNFFVPYFQFEGGVMWSDYFGELPWLSGVLWEERR